MTQVRETNVSTSSVKVIFTYEMSEVGLCENRVLFEIMCHIGY